MNQLKAAILLWMSDKAPVNLPWNMEVIGAMEEMIQEELLEKQTHPDGVYCYVLTQKAMELVSDV